MWVNSLFRNESEVLSSKLILEAIAATRWFYTNNENWNCDPEPKEGLITFVDSSEVKSSNPGFCYKKAGFSRVGYTQERKLVALQLPLSDMPAPKKPKPYLKYGPTRITDILNEPI